MPAANLLIKYGASRVNDRLAFWLLAVRHALLAKMRNLLAILAPLLAVRHSLLAISQGLLAKHIAETLISDGQHKERLQKDTADQLFSVLEKQKDYIQCTDMIYLYELCGLRYLLLNNRLPEFEAAAAQMQEFFSVFFLKRGQLVMTAKAQPIPGIAVPVSCSVFCDDNK
ncbi:hypothetical protein M1K46_03625 [Fictibacillus sp. WQ 8-8]|uniref:hypothetical protein n=1 Tax=Fictibacillus sp. WQ 8-8 TaxID=2938788 RepID=UPI00210E8F22|nr:hypothetical protein [Fictibacillus sp. WQ 8-8]MCQ6264756.1 hypothetical protein [Fictibacillus sp. WQ 8-8]